MLTLEQAQAAILSGIRPGHEHESVALTQAVGRFVAEPILARVDNPAFDNSAMDGYAVRLADLAQGRHRLPLRGEASGGDAPGVLAPATTMRIFTGAPLPAGADAVVIQEDVRVEAATATSLSRGPRLDPTGESGAVIFPTSLSAGQNIRRRGEDFRTGDTLYKRGERLAAYDIALLATAGVAEVAVARCARALVVATGNELVAPGEPLKPGQIYESNRLATLLQLQALGVEAVDGGTVRDDPAALRALLARSTDFAGRTEARVAGQEWPDGGFDFIITSGGASVGDHDLVKQVFAELGTIQFWKARIKPGKPIAFGHIGERTHFFALPGNPVSSLVTFKLFVEPALIAWHGGTPAQLMLTAQAANDFRRRPGRTEFLRARLFSRDGTLHVEALKGQGSHMLHPLRDTNAFIRIEDESDGFRSGQAVRVLPLRLDRV
jgi:molybdopterin molybdotransferase